MAKRKRKRRAWTNAEIDYLRLNYGLIPVPEMAKKLGRIENSIYTKIRELGIPKNVEIGEPPGPPPPEEKDSGLKPGDRVRVTLPSIPGLKKTGESRWTKRVYTGRVLRVHDRYILIQLPGWKECVNVGTLISGEAQIELLEGRKAA